MLYIGSILDNDIDKISESDIRTFISVQCLTITLTQYQNLISEFFYKNQHWDLILAEHPLNMTF